MDSQIVDAVAEWDTASFGGGYDGLTDLADAEFSGAIKTASTWAFMLNGNIIGVVDGSITAFDGADGTAYEAPDPSLPLLYTMQCGDSEKQAEYYTKDTAISEADDTLSSGNFTGYIKLSENVHSGDYYIVYYGGRSMSVAFVGNSRKLHTGDEAFERANDEIGIYRVYAADIDVIDIPETESNTAAPTDTGITVADTQATDSRTADDESNEPPDSDGDDESAATTSRRPTDASETATNGGGASESTGGEPDATMAGSGTADDATTTASTEPTAADTTSAPQLSPQTALSHPATQAVAALPTAVWDRPRRPVAPRQPRHQKTRTGLARSQSGKIRRLFHRSIRTRRLPRREDRRAGARSSPSDPQNRISPILTASHHASS